MQNAPHHSLRSAGFTLLELVVVMLIVGILAIGAAARFQDKDGFSEVALQKRMLSALRAVQQQAMQNTLNNPCYLFVFDNTNGQFGPANPNTCSTSVDFTQPAYLRTEAGELQAEGISLSVIDNGSGSITAVRFNQLGQPVQADGNARICSAFCTVNLTGESTQQVCIESEGFVHTGVCGG
ncbi:type II secretion system protein [Bowmanella sp. JS7-9]|uniref:Type II secretion system protein n=1 Tax=Pseudobowmanella zhangzhouensis TaxID=1537679 RepID=A0ABW1XN26_9ALTE|nr:type II secretion system protein [Bowmanella sp. JS7-9]TBX21796.1 hypothetical protein TK45_09785 [Bowmanella sp. JS7-9]